LIYSRYKHLDYAGAVSPPSVLCVCIRSTAQIDYAYYLRALANFEADKDAFLRFIPLIPRIVI
jgi:outer membrane protein assembly factor BamD (BamD/ComL family)